MRATLPEGTDMGTAVENPRAERSRIALLEAMTRELDEGKGEAALSVSMIARSAGVSRPTLYQHFGDLPSLVRSAAMRRLIALFDTVPAPSADPRDHWRESAAKALGALLAELDSRRGFYLTVLDSPAGDAVREDIIEFLAARITDMTALGAHMRDEESTDEDVRERARFLSAAALWRTERWMRSDDREATSAFALRLSRLLAASAGVPRD